MPRLGLRFPFGRSATSFPAQAVGDDVVDQNIRRICQTRRGSRVMRPTVGASAYDFVFESTGPVLSSRMDFELRQAIADGEPSADVISIGCTERKTNTGVEILVTIVYEVNGNIRRTSVSFSDNISNQGSP